MHKRLLITVLKAILTFAVLYFVGRQLVEHWEDVSSFDWRFDLWSLALSLGFALAAFWLFAVCWRLVIGGFGFSVSAPHSFKIAYLSNLGRYIPGKIWQMFGMLYLAGKEGIPAEQATASFVITQLFAVPSSLLVFVFASQIDRRIVLDQIALLGPLSGWILLAGLLLLNALVIVYPDPLVAVANAVLRKIGRPTVRFTLDKKVALVVFAGYVLGWICYGLAFWLFLVGVIGFRIPGPVAAVGLFNGAYQIGYLALFAPGGFGPRELVMGQLLAPFLGTIAPATAVLARVWAMAIETVAALWALTIRK